jgi:hypothetical protein
MIRFFGRPPLYSHLSCVSSSSRLVSSFDSRVRASVRVPIDALFGMCFSMDFLQVSPSSSAYLPGALPCSGTRQMGWPFWRRALTPITRVQVTAATGPSSYLSCHRCDSFESALHRSLRSLSPSACTFSSPASHSLGLLRRKVSNINSLLGSSVF